MSEVICPECGDKYHTNSLGWHYWDSDHGYPDPSPRQTEIIEGLLMGDASAVQGHRNENGNAHIHVHNSNNMFIGWVRGEMGVLATEPTIATKNTNDSHNKTTHWRVRLRANPNYNKYIDWCSGNEVPKIKELTPLRAKCWFACDGNVKWNGNNASIAIGVANNKRSMYYHNLLNDNGFDTTIHEYELSFTKESSERFLEWVGSPLPGFKHKWEIEDCNEHYRLKDMEYWTDQDYESE